MRSSTRTRLQTYLEYIFDGMPLAGRQVLDIGAGIGMYSMYAAACGARQVISLEPEEAGSRTKSRESLGNRFLAARSQLGLEQVELLAVPFDEFDTKDHRFDVILLHNVINHLDEAATERLQFDPQAWKAYRDIARRLYDLTAPGGTVIIADATRYSFFGLPLIRSYFPNPFTPGVEWEKHQDPRLWANVFRQAGFQSSRIRWTAPSRLGGRGTWLVSNRVFAYFTSSQFCLQLHK